MSISLLEPDYTKLQTAADADAFVALLDQPGRAIGAALADMVFALSYGVLGVIGLRVHGGETWYATAGGVAVATGAFFDEIENMFVIANIVARDTITDAWINAMQIPGTLKWIATPGFLLLFGLILVRAVQGLAIRRRARTRSPVGR